MDRGTLIFEINHIVRSIDAVCGLNEVDMSARAILDFIAEAYFVGRPLRSSDIVKISKFGTAPTVYSHLAKLENAGWILYKAVPVDRRAKHILLTPPAKRAFNRMSREVQKLLMSV